MRLLYANATYRDRAITGGNVHVGQFISNAVALGHEIWVAPENEHPAAKRLPLSKIDRLKIYRQIDAIYVRIEHYPPGVCRWGMAPYRQLAGSPLMIWEFNTVPGYGKVHGQTETEIRQSIETFKRYAPGCDLAVCVSDALSDYVSKYLGIKKAITVPNGSDPELFRLDILPVKRVERKPDQLNVVWIGSADLAWHNFDLLCRTAKCLWENGNRNRVAFHIIGSGLKFMSDMPPNIHYHGAENYSAIPRWLAVMDVGLCFYRPGPADFGSPLKLFDYMASGLTVVGTSQPQVREVFAKLGQLDLLITPDDSERLAAILLELAANRERVRRQGNAGRQLVIDFYNWRRAVRDTIHEIDGLLQAQRNGQRH